MHEANYSLSRVNPKCHPKLCLADGTISQEHEIDDWWRLMFCAVMRFPLSYELKSKEGLGSETIYIPPGALHMVPASLVCIKVLTGVKRSMAIGPKQKNDQEVGWSQHRNLEVKTLPTSC